MQTLIIGGARSGKSALAERLAAADTEHIVYIATGFPGDAEMAARIVHHRARRPAHWGLVEEPLALAETLARAAGPDVCLLVDCLTLWLSNLLCAADTGAFGRERDALIRTLPQLAGSVILVSNEVGQGVVPLGELSRRFVDEAGRLHQDIAASADRVILTVAGLPLVLKGAL